MRTEQIGEFIASLSNGRKLTIRICREMLCTALAPSGEVEVCKYLEFEDGTPVIRIHQGEYLAYDSSHKLGIMAGDILRAANGP